MQIDSLHQAPSKASTDKPVAKPVTSPSSGSESILPTGSLFDAVGVVLDLSREGRDLLGSYASLSADDQATYLQVISSVLQQGVVGTETVEVQGRPRETFVSTRMGDERLRHAPTYRGSRLDVTA